MTKAETMCSVAFQKEVKLCVCPPNFAIPCLEFGHPSRTRFVLFYLIEYIINILIKYGISYLIILLYINFS